MAKPDVKGRLDAFALSLIEEAQKTDTDDAVPYELKVKAFEAVTKYFAAEAKVSPKGKSTDDRPFTGLRDRLKLVEGEK